MNSLTYVVGGKVILGKIGSFRYESGDPLDCRRRFGFVRGFRNYELRITNCALKPKPLNHDLCSAKSLHKLPQLLHTRLGLGHQLELGAGADEVVVRVVGVVIGIAVQVVA